MALAGEMGWPAYKEDFGGGFLPIVPQDSSVGESAIIRITQVATPLCSAAAKLP